MRISKPVEELVGDNRGIVRLKLGNIHCMTPPREAIREIRSTIQNWDKVPKELRRGFYLCVLETLAEYRGTYLSVVTGNFGHMEK
jgi:hypothetical protein